MKTKYFKLIFISILPFIISGCSQKEPDYYFKKAGKKHNIDYKIMRSIAEVESNNRDYVINVNGSHLFKGSHYFESSFKANLYMDLVLDITFANYDIGVCQVNKWWLDKFDIDNEDLLDRETNINYATIIFKDNLKVCKEDIRCALSRYNTGKKSSKIGFKYADKVLSAKKRLFKQ